MIVIRKQKRIEEAPATPAEMPVLNKELVIEDLKTKLEDILKLMVVDSSDVRIIVEQGERTTIFKVFCGKQNIAKILGRSGKTIDALRTVVMAISGHHGFRAIIEVPYFSGE